MNRVLEGVQAELELLGQIRAYCDRREEVLRDLEQRAGQLEPLNFDPAEAEPESKPAPLPPPRESGRRAKRLAPPGLPPPSRTQDRSVTPVTLESESEARRARRRGIRMTTEERDAAVLEALTAMEPCASSDLMRRLGWSQSSVCDALARLRPHMVQSIGRGRSVRWYLTATLDRRDAEEPGAVDDMAAREAERAAVHRRLACREDLLRTFRVEPGAWTEERICATKAWAAEDVEAVCAALLEEGVAQRNYDGTYSLDDVWLATSEAA